MIVLFMVILAGAVGAGAGVRWYVETRPDVSAGPSDPITPTAAPTTFPRLDVRMARSGGDMVITNAGDQPWTACTVDLNAGVPGGAFSSALPGVEPGERVSLPLGAFARADGQPFDPGAGRVHVVDLHCGTPGGPAHFSGGP